MLLTSGIMDMALLVFISVLLCKYTFFKDKDSKGLKWIAAGGAMLLVTQAILFNIDWTTFGISNLSMVNFAVLLVSGIIIVIGCVKLILDLFE